MAPGTLTPHEPPQMQDHQLGEPAGTPPIPAGPTSTRREPQKAAVLPTGSDKVKAVRHMFSAIAPRYELVNTLMTFGLDRSWRRQCIEALDLPQGSTALDVACGTGDLCRELARHGLRPVGIDLTPRMLALAGTSAPLVLGDALAAPFPDSAFDGAVSGFALRNVVDLRQMFGELARLVRPRGRISLLDLGEPENPVLRAGHRFWSSYAIPLIGAALSDGPAYRYLPRSLAYLPPPDEVAHLLEMAGFVAVEHAPLSGGACQLFAATRAHDAQSAPEASS